MQPQQNQDNSTEALLANVLKTAVAETQQKKSMSLN